MTVPVPVTTDVLIGQVAARAPDTPALISAGQAITFTDLDARSRELAASLREYGVSAQTPVAVLLPRSAEQVLATLAIWQAGGVCVPVEHSLPERRIARLLAASGAECLIDASGRVSRLSAAPPAGWVPVSGEHPQTGERLAYIFFTSGSTGAPKVVGVPHSGIVNEALWTRDAFGLGTGDRCGWVAAPSFALTRWAVWSPLVAGAAVQVADEGVEWTSTGLRDWLIAREVTWTVLVTTTGERLLALPWPAKCGLRTMVVGGEQLRIWPQSVPFEVVNSYGVTETCVRLAAWLPRNGSQDRLPPIGTPVADTVIQVLDGDWRPVAQGGVGELFIGGAGLAHGYLGSPGQTASRFVPCPAGRPGTRMYRTGDLVRVSADGAVEYVGRILGDAKVNGVRVNVAEVEAALLEHPSVEDACVVIRPGPTSRAELVAYVTGLPGTRLVAYEIVEFLAEQLPSAMIPARLVQLRNIPRLVSGKADRVGLPPPDEQNELKDALVAPRDEIEAIIVAVFGATLSAGRVSIHDDYMGLGGTSLGLFRVRQLLAERLRVRVSVAELFECRTAAQMAKLLHGRQRSISESVAVAETDWRDCLDADEAEDLLAVESGGQAVPLSYAQRRIWYMDRLQADSTAYVEVITIHASSPLRAEVLSQALSDLVEWHDVLRSTFVLGRHHPISVIHPGGVAPALNTICASGPDADVPALLAEAGVLAPFDLGQELPVRFALLSLPSGDNLLAVAVHHIVWDGRSAEILMEDLAELYAHALSGVRATVPPVRASYSDHVFAERRAAAAPHLAESSAYWLHQLYGVRLAGWRRRALAGSGPRSADCVELVLPSGFLPGLRALSAETGCTLTVAGLAGMAGVLRRLFGADELTICTPVSTRDERTMRTLGLFLNMVPLRLTVTTGDTWRTLLAATRATCLAAWEHSDLEFEQIVQCARLRRGTGGVELSGITFEYVRLPDAIAGLADGGSSWRLRWHPCREAKGDLFAGLIETMEGLTIRVVYDRLVFHEEDARWLAARLRDALRQMTDDVDAPVFAESSAILEQSAAPRLPSGAPPDAAVLSAAAAVWCEVLGPERVGLDDNFFDLGGDSTSALRIASKLSAIFDVDIPLRTVFDAQSFGDFVAAIRPGDAGPCDSANGFCIA